MNLQENGQNQMAGKNRKQTVKLSSSFKTHSLVRFIFYDEEIQFLPCTYHVTELEPVPSNFTKYHTLNIAQVDLSPPPLVISKMFCFCFLFVRFFFLGWSVEGVSWG